MRIVLMSFWPSIYDKIFAGEKIIEYRYRYCGEATFVYMYVSKPIKEIIGVLELAEKIDLNDWRSEYENNINVVARVDEYLKKYRYAMPVRSFQRIKGITLKGLRDNVNGFFAPQSYIYVDKNKTLQKYLEENTTPIGEKMTNNFDNAFPKHICLRYL